MSWTDWENRDIAVPKPIMNVVGMKDNIVPVDGEYCANPMFPEGECVQGAPLEQLVDFWAIDVN